MVTVTLPVIGQLGKRTHDVLSPRFRLDPKPLDSPAAIYALDRRPPRSVQLELNIPTLRPRRQQPDRLSVRLQQHQLRRLQQVAAMILVFFWFKY